jgi:hypothetical protein
MSPKEKAEEFIEKFVRYTPAEEEFEYPYAKQCALIAADEVMEFMKMDDEYTETVSNANSKWVHYWQEVKQEIETYGGDNV